MGNAIGPTIGDTSSNTTHIPAVSVDTALHDIASAAELGSSQNLWPFLLYAISVVALLAVVLIAAKLLGAKSQHNAATDMPFESGILPVGSAEQTRMSIEFYLIAMFFVIFDLETIFIFAWGVAFFELGWTGYIGASAFILILLVVLVYEWRTGALDWGALTRRARSDFSTRQEAD